MDIDEHRAWCSGETLLLQLLDRAGEREEKERDRDRVSEGGEEEGFMPEMLT